MPFVRIDPVAGKSSDDRRGIADAVCDALLAIEVPKDDRFAVIAEHPAGDLLLDPTHLGIERVTVVNGVLILDFAPTRGRALVSAIAIRKQ